MPESLCPCWFLPAMNRRLKSATKKQNLSLSIVDSSITNKAAFTCEMSRFTLKTFPQPPPHQSLPQTDKCASSPKDCHFSPLLPPSLLPSCDHSGGKETARRRLIDHRASDALLSVYGCQSLAHAHGRNGGRALS